MNNGTFCRARGGASETAATAANRIISVSCATNSHAAEKLAEFPCPKTETGRSHRLTVDSFCLSRSSPHSPIFPSTTAPRSIQCHLPAGRRVVVSPRLPRQLQVAGSPKPSLRPLRVPPPSNFGFRFNWKGAVQPQRTQRTQEKQAQENRRDHLSVRTRFRSSSLLCDPCDLCGYSTAVYRFKPQANQPAG